MNHDNYDDNYIRGILNGVKSIAMVGASPVNVRPSYFAFKYLAQRGYDMIPVNPGHVGKSLLDKPFVASLRDIGRPVDMIDIFRNSTHIMPVVEEALQLDPLPKVIWMQLGARDDAAAAKAEAAGIKVVMNRCPKIEYGRLSSEISWMGVNSRARGAVDLELVAARSPRPAECLRGGAGRPCACGSRQAARDPAHDSQLQSLHGLRGASDDAGRTGTAQREGLLRQTQSSEKGANHHESANNLEPARQGGHSCWISCRSEHCIGVAELWNDDQQFLYHIQSDGSLHR